MEFRILGPLEAVDDGRAVELPRRKHRALLAALLLRAGEPVSADRLIEDLWGESPPRTARDALQNYVSLVRMALGPDVLVTRDVGYLLDVSPDQVDLARFERLTAEARTIAEAADRAQTLREALALWRGPPLADLVYEPFAWIEIGRLEDMRLAATQDLIDAELELGQHADLVPELEALIEQHPFDERLRAQLMLALYRGGRQAEALEAYQAARRALDEELGLEPGPPLRELEQGILRHDPSLGAAAPPRTPPSRRTVTVLFANVEKARDPETIGSGLEQVRAAVARHGGQTSFTGDAVMSVFGVPHAHEDDALRAVRAAVDLGGAPRVGIATGEVYAGGEIVAGAPVTLARRLEQAARPGELLLAPSTLRLVRDAVRSRRTTRRGLTAFRIDELIEGAPGIAPHFETPLVGREAELAELRRAFDTAREERRCVVVTVVGDAGIGKTRLARELVAALGDEATVLVGRCVSYGEGATFQPLTEMIGPSVLDAGSTGEIFLAVRRRFEELAAERSLLLLFDDVHWAEPTLLDFVEYLGAQMTETPVLVLCLARPELLAERARWIASVVLEPLTDEQARELAGDRPHTERVVEIAEGNPLYVEQLLAYVQEEGEAALDTVPGSIEALLASRVDGLGSEERAVAQRAAVIGRRFSPTAVAGLGPVDALPSLEQAGFVHRARDAYRFHHVLVRDVVYAGTPKAERAELHQRHADWLDGQPDGTDELIGHHLEQAAVYLGELGAPKQRVERISTNAGHRLGAAGVRSWKRGDARAAVNLLGRATALLPEHDPERLGLMCELGGALRTSGSFPDAEAVLTAVRDGAAGNRALEVRAGLELLQLGLFVDPAGVPHQLLEQATAAIPLLEGYGDDRALGRTWLLLGSVLGPYLFRYAEAAAAMRKGILHYERAGWPSSACLGTLSSALVDGPTPVGEAIAECERIMAEADLNGQANVLAPLGALEAMQGEFDRARSHASRARELYAELGQPLTAEYTGAAAECQIELLAGDLRGAQEMLERSHAALARAGERTYLATCAATLADVLYRRGRWQEAEESMRAAREGSDQDDLATEWRWRAVAGKLLARRGEHVRAEALLREALTVFDDTDALIHHAACLVDLAEALGVAGRRAEAGAALEQALALYERKGNVVASRRTRTLLAETRESP